jgi:TolB-like protein
MVTPLGALRRKLTITNQPCLFQSVVQGMCHGLWVAGLALMLSASACSSRYDDMPAFWPIPMKEYDNYGPGRFKTALLAAQIDRYYRGSAPGPIGVTTFVNIDDLYASSTFGRMVGEQLMSELAMKGFDVVELRQADALQFLNTSGEFALSRDVRAVRPHRNLAAVVVGTYVVSPERVYVNARLIEPSTSLILSAGSVEMSKTRELAKMLRGGTMPGSLERIPVKALGYADQSNQMEVMKRNWMMEESGEWSMPSRSSAAARLPEIAAPPAVSQENSAGSKPPAPKVLEEVPALPLPDSKPRIGLGN